MPQDGASPQGGHGGSAGKGKDDAQEAQVTGMAMARCSNASGESGAISGTNLRPNSVLWMGGVDDPLIPHNFCSQGLGVIFRVLCRQFFVIYVC